MKTKLFITAALAISLSACSKFDEIRDNRVTPRDFLSDKKYESLVIEIQFVDGYKPSTEAVDNLKKLLEDHLHKPAGIAVQYRVIPSPQRSFYDVADLEKIEKQNRTQLVHGSTVAAYFLFLDGAYAHDAGNSKVLGLAYGSTSMAIFGKTIDEFSGDLGQPAESKLVSTVMQHEFCHILGLVNSGSNMVDAHEDADHIHHCNNTTCLMHFAVETSSVANVLTGGEVPQLDQNCIKDLIANGGR